MTLEFSHITITVPLVSLEDAKTHLRITDPLYDADVTDTRDAAQAYVIARLGVAADATWTETTVPLPIQRSILLVLDGFWERRGGDETNDTLQKSLAVMEILIAPFHDPTVGTS